MRKSVLIITILTGIVISLSVVKAIVYNRLSTEGVFVAEMEKQISFYKTQNAILLEELLESSSLIHIVTRAEKLGFTNKNSSLLVLKTSRPLAVKR